MRALALIAACSILCLAVPAFAEVFPQRIVDVRGVTVTIPAKPQRIVSLAPNNTEILFAIGAGSRVVADTEYCDYPPAAAKLPKVGGYLDPSVEKVVAMKPDLVLVTRGTRTEMIDRIAAFKVPVVCLDPESLPEVCDAVTTIGRAVGELAAARRLALHLRIRHQKVLLRMRELPAAKRPVTLFLFDLNGLYSVGPGSHIDTMITEAGGRNVGATAKTPWPQLSMETVIAANPTVILLVQGVGMGTKLTPARALAKLRADRRWAQVAAVKQGRLFMLDVDAMTLPGPRMVDGLEAMARALHPELAAPPKGKP
jgi:iron complex transport system substrate-binding protein